MEHRQLVIIGGGPAGMAAAIAAYDRGIRDILIVDREPELGGILRQCIHNGFGLHKLGRELTGPEYAWEFEKQVRQRNIDLRLETMVVNLTADRVLTLQSRQGMEEIQAGAVILTMGCRERSRGALSLPGTRPAGVFSAGTAQKLVNMQGLCVGKRVVILGSGDIGLIMARRMTLQGAKVEAVCELMPYSGGLARNITQCLEDFNIPLYLSTTVAEIHGKERVEGVTIAQVDASRRVIPETARYIPCDTLLLSVGLVPENELTRQAGIPMDAVTGGAIVRENCETLVPGIFACGNVLQVHDLVDYVSDEAERAGIGAAEFLQNGETGARQLSVTTGFGVRYVVPQKINRDGEGDVSLFFRVGRPFGKVRIVVKAGDREIASVRRLRAAPGEMEKLTLHRELLTDEDLRVELEELA